MLTRSITVAIFGGLGNQMFQYAAGRALSLRCQVPLFLDAHHFSCQQKPIRTYQLSVFPNLSRHIAGVASTPLCFPQRVWRRIRQRLPWSSDVSEPHFAYWPGFRELQPPAILHGYWQSEKYFSDVQAEIRHDFSFPPLPDGPASHLAAHIASTPNAVSVHVRRGDYISNPQALAFHGTLPESYYKAALQYLMEVCGPTTLFLFSDEPHWVHEHFDCCGHTAFVVDVATLDAPHIDMYLMSLCQHHIIANSSFSWWGAWLGQAQGVTFAPQRWFADESINTSDICPERWIRL